MLRSSLDMLSGFLPVLAVSAAWVAVVFVDVVVLKTRCVENSPVEWIQFAAVSFAGAAMCWRAVRQARGRGAFILASAFFLDMAIREQDGLLDTLLWHGSWVYPVAAVTASAFALVLALRLQGTLAEGLAEIRSSRLFHLLATGLVVVIGVSRIMGIKNIWRIFGRSEEIMFAKRVVEESVELFGYGLVLAWAVSFALEFRASEGSGARGGASKK